LIDVIIIGAGIAGAATAFRLSYEGLRVVVLEANEICSGGSAAAGAFLSPKISKPSPYKTYLNDALAYTLDFYQSRFPHLLRKNGLLKIPLDDADIKRCRSYEPFIDFTWEKRGDNYFFPNAGIIPPKALCQALLEDVEVHEHTPVESLRFHEEAWIVNEKLQAKYLILATGDNTELFPLPYLETKRIGGYRYDVTFEGMEKIQCNMHKDLSISTFMDDHTIIGASHLKGEIDLDKAAQEDSWELLTKAATWYTMPNLKRQKSYTGYRLFTFDYFPIAGKVVDAKKTMQALPYIKSGAKVPYEKYHYYPNLYIHTALGSRGFVFAPYNAELIAKSILHEENIPQRLLPAYRFQKWFRKQL